MFALQRVPGLEVAVPRSLPDSVGVEYSAVFIAVLIIAAFAVHQKAEVIRMTIGMLPLLILGETNVVLRTVRRVHFLMFIPVIVGIKYYDAFFTTDDIARRSVQVVMFVVIII